MLRIYARAAAGAYDGVDNAQQLAVQLSIELNSVGRRTMHTPPGDEAFGDAQWLIDGVAYLRINGQA